MHVGINYPSPIFWKDWVFAPLDSLGTRAKNHFTIYVRVYFWTHFSITLIYMSVFMPVSTFILIYSSFLVCFEIRKCGSANHVVFQNCLGLGYVGCLEIAYEFYNEFLYLFNKSHRGFDSNCIKSVDCFGLSLIDILII